MTRFTKIVATLGPATSSDEALRRLLSLGVNIVRINASHGQPDEHRQRIEQVRSIAADLKTSVGILFDLQGPKIRIVGAPEAGLSLAKQQSFTIASEASQQEGVISIDAPQLLADCKVGERILFEDGRVQAQIERVAEGEIGCVALNAGTLFNRKGVNLPDTRLSLPSLTDKDRIDAVTAIETQVDMIALSFVRSAKDIHCLSDLLAEHDVSIPIVAKIEKPQAVDNLESILEASWGVMVARGDLGVELAAEEVPMVQKHIIRRAVHWGKPVITATQMLDSMTNNPRPTRAETSDVANAVLDGTDAVMLSGETAMGDYPFETVQVMDRIIQATESSGESMPAQPARDLSEVNESVANATSHVAHQLKAKAVAVFTRTGTTARLIARRRGKTPLLAFTPDASVARQLSLVWGVTSFQIPRAESVDQRVKALDAALLDDGLAQKGDVIVLCMASPKAPAGSTNVLIVHRVGSDLSIPKTVPLD